MENFFYIPKDPTRLWLFIGGALLVSVGGFLGLRALPTRARRPLVMLVTFLTGLVFALEFFLPVNQEGENFLSDYTNIFSQNLFQTITGLTLGLGVFSLVRLHTRNVVQKREGWYNSMVLLGSLVAMSVVSTWYLLGIKEKIPKPPFIDAAYDLLFNRMFAALDATMFSIIAFYIFSAAYRAFRIRSVEAGILMFTAMVVMIGNVPIGYNFSEGLNLPPDGGFQFLRIEIVKQWLLERLNAPANRAVEFGLGIGGLAMALRLWLSLERGIGVER